MRDHGPDDAYARARRDPDFLEAVRQAYAGRLDVPNALWWMSHPADAAPDGAPPPLDELRDLQRRVFSASGGSLGDPEATRAVRELEAELAAEREAITDAVDDADPGHGPGLESLFPVDPGEPAAPSGVAGLERASPSPGNTGRSAGRGHLVVVLGLVAALAGGILIGTQLSVGRVDASTSGSRSVAPTPPPASAAEVDWITEQMRRVFPREWDRFAAAVGPLPGERIIDAYFDRITDPDPDVRERTALAWCAWEDVHVSLDPRDEPSPRYADPHFRLLFAPLVIHYWKHAAFTGDAGLLAGMGRISHLPGVLIHGRLDVSSPLETAWALHEVWPGSELIVVDDEGHGGDTMIDELIRAVDRFSTERATDSGA